MAARCGAESSVSRDIVNERGVPNSKLTLARFHHNDSNAGSKQLGLTGQCVQNSRVDTGHEA